MLRRASALVGAVTASNPNGARPRITPIWCDDLSQDRVDSGAMAADRRRARVSRRVLRRATAGTGISPTTFRLVGDVHGAPVLVFAVEGASARELAARGMAITFDGIEAGGEHVLVWGTWSGEGVDRAMYHVVLQVADGQDRGGALLRRRRSGAVVRGALGTAPWQDRTRRRRVLMAPRPVRGLRPSPPAAPPPPASSVPASTASRRRAIDALDEREVVQRERAHRRSARGCGPGSAGSRASSPIAHVGHGQPSMSGSSESRCSAPWRGRRASGRRGRARAPCRGAPSRVGIAQSNVSMPRCDAARRGRRSRRCRAGGAGGRRRPRRAPRSPSRRPRTSASLSAPSEPPIAIPSHARAATACALSTRRSS